MLQVTVLVSMITIPEGEEMASQFCPGFELHEHTQRESISATVCLLGRHIEREECFPQKLERKRRVCPGGCRVSGSAPGLCSLDATSPSKPQKYLWTLPSEGGRGRCRQAPGESH